MVTFISMLLVEALIQPHLKVIAWPLLFNFIDALMHKSISLLTEYVMSTRHKGYVW